MDPNQLYALLAQMRQQQPGGMFAGAAQPGMGGMSPPGAGMPSAAPPTGMLPPTGQPEQDHHHSGLNPLMALSPGLGLMMSHPKYGLMALSPGIGLANLLGAFK